MLSTLSLVRISFSCLLTVHKNGVSANAERNSWKKKMRFSTPNPLPPLHLSLHNPEKKTKSVSGKKGGKTKRKRMTQKNVRGEEREVSGYSTAQKLARKRTRGEASYFGR